MCAAAAEFLTWLNAVEDKRVGSPATAFHLTMQLAGCKTPSFLHASLWHQWERLRASLPLAPAFAKAIAEFAKYHPLDTPSTIAPGQSPVVQAQKTNQSAGSRGSRGCAHSDPAQFPVSCNVVSAPPSQPMCARVLAIFLRSHFHDNLCWMSMCVRKCPLLTSGFVRRPGRS